MRDVGYGGNGDELNVEVAFDGFAERALFARIDAVPGNH